MSLVDAVAIIARLMQFSAAAVLGGGGLFFLYGVTPTRTPAWPSRLFRLASGIGVLGTLGWLMAQAAQIGDASTDALDPTKVWSVSADTGFGRVALARLGLFVLGFMLTTTAWRARRLWLALAALGMATSASFAWTGHGMGDEGWPGGFHQFADVAHLLAASVWIGALAVLAVFAVIARRTGPAADAGRDLHMGLARFSAIGLAVVAALVVSGLANSWFLIGSNGLGRVLTTTYGRLLLVKLAVFGIMLALAAVNRYRLTSRLEQAVAADGAPGSFRPVIISILCETLLAVLVLALVSWLGTLPPPIDG